MDKELDNSSILLNDIGRCQQKIVFTVIFPTYFLCFFHFKRILLLYEKLMNLLNGTKDKGCTYNRKEAQKRKCSVSKTTNHLTG